MYLLGVILLTGLCVGISKIVKEPIPKEALYACRMFTGDGLLDFSVPSISTAVLTFTATYIMFQYTTKKLMLHYLHFYFL